MPHRSSKTFEKIIRQAIAGREVLLLTYDDVELPDGRLIDQLRKEMINTFYS